STIPLRSVTRIEIVRGGDYSAPGLAGSVNFLTDDGGGDRRIAASGERGNNGFESYSFRTGGFGPAGLNLTLEADNSFYRGDFSFIDPRDSIQTRQNNFYRTSKMFGTINYNRKRGVLKFSGRYFRRNAGVPGPIFQLTPEANSNIEEKEIYTRFSQGFGFYSELDLTAGVTNRRANYDSPRTPINFIPYKTVFDDHSRDIKIRFQRTGRIDLDSYLGIRYESLDGNDLIRPAASFGFRSRLVNALGIAASYRFNGSGIFTKSSAITFGLRKEGGDHGDFWAPSVTSRINLDLPARPGFDFSYSRARRLPNLTDLYWKEDVFATPNADLQPEESRSYQIGFDLQNDFFGLVDLRVSRYLTDFDNLIIWRRWAGDKFKPVNLSRAEINGWDVSLEANLFDGPVSLHWVAAFTRPLNKESELSHHDKFLTFRPIGTQNAGIEFDFENLKLRLARRHIGRRYTTEENTKSLPPVDLVDFEINYGLKLRSIETALRIDITNIGDIQYEILDRQPQRPREYKLKLEIRKIGGF
ncbi:MAG: TonB-dependent receptor, partial [candidate division Zixibacteria bacterium]